MIYKRNNLFFLSILFFVLLATTIFPKGILRTEGKIIVDADGKEIVFKGIGLGGWLVPEGYMFNMSGFANSPSEIKSKIIGVVGEANAEIIYNNFRKTFITEADIDSIASWGFNNIRLPMHYELLTPRNEPYVYSEYGFEIIDSLVKWCKKNDIYLILDLHAAPGGQSAEPISDYDSRYPSLWENEENKAVDQIENVDQQGQVVVEETAKVKTKAKAAKVTKSVMPVMICLTNLLGILVL